MYDKIPATHERKLKQVVAVITFDDADGEVTNLSEAARWIEGGLTKRSGFVDVTTYTTAERAARDEEDSRMDFSYPAERVGSAVASGI